MPSVHAELAMKLVLVVVPSHQDGNEAHGARRVRGHHRRTLLRPTGAADLDGANLGFDDVDALLRHLRHLAILARLGLWRVVPKILKQLQDWPFDGAPPFHVRHTGPINSEVIGQLILSPVQASPQPADINDIAHGHQCA